jgi:uncharacterized protein (DUF58 family)
VNGSGTPGAGGDGFLPPRLLERLGGLEIVARTLVRGFVAGTHRSPFRGAGDEFARHRTYQQGDDVRRLDWKLYGRSDRLFVREFEERSNLRCFLVLDCSLSMGYADGDGLSKLRYGTYVAAALAYAMLGAGDSVGLSLFGDDSRVQVPARNRRGHLHEILLHLERAEAAGDRGAADALDRVGETLPRGGRVVLISDLLDRDGWAARTALGRLRARGDEVIVMRLLTPEELGDRPLDAGLFFDPERPGEVVPAAPALDGGYRNRVDGFFSELARELRGRGVEYLPLSTAQPVEHALMAWAGARR